MDASAWSPPSDPDAVHPALVAWFDAHHRSFPWRDTDDPWAILVLEVMSQQTQLDRVTEAWAAFVDRWPTPESLAADAKAEVIAFWSDHRLGYNRRAGYLHDAAGRIVADHDGAVPAAPAALEELPGVGPYTANAVASFAFDAGDAVVDTNVKRILHRAFDVPDRAGAYAAALDVLAPADDVGAWNEAVMELGGVACTKTPRCDEAACPLRRWCTAYRTGDFTAHDVPTQPPYAGSRRQYRGRVLEALATDEATPLAALGPAIRVDHDPDEPDDRAWLRSLLEDMAADGLVELEGSSVRLPR